MTDRFETRFAAAIESYAATMPVDVDAHAYAGALLRRGLARPRWARLGVDRLGGPRMAWAVLAVILAMALLSALAAGAWLAQRRSLADDPLGPRSRALAVPGELHGVWDGGAFLLDFRSPTLLTHVLDSATRPDLGGASSFDRQVGSAETFTFVVDGPCGEGRYTVVREHSDTLRFTAQRDACVERRDILTGNAWQYGDPFLAPRLGPFAIGQTYTSGIFTEPFRFVMPPVDDPDPNLASQMRSASTYVSAGGLAWAGMYWSMVVLDDPVINANLCDAASPLLADIPATPAEVGDWLRTNSAWLVSEPAQVPVDGRTALRFDLSENPSPIGCAEGARVPAGGFFTYSMRAYAVPTGDDTILIIFGSDEVNWEAVKAWAEAFVRSMDFQ